MALPSVGLTVGLEMQRHEGTESGADHLGTHGVVETAIDGVEEFGEHRGHCRLMGSIGATGPHND